jgi:hypothetical protein
MFTAIIAIPSYHIGFLDIFEVDNNTYFANPKNSWESLHYPPEYVQFYFSKIGSTWKTEPHVLQNILEQVIEQGGL